jgi:hypothetical protein
VTQESIDEACNGVVSADPKRTKKTGVVTNADDTNVEVLKTKLKRRGGGQDRAEVRSQEGYTRGHGLSFRFFYCSKPDFTSVNQLFCT